MEITSTGTNSFKITGEIKTISDYQTIKNQVQPLVEQGNKSLTIVIEDAQTITSSIVGYLMKIVNLNGVKLTLTVKNQKLYKLLEDLVLLEIFNVQK